MIKLTTNIRLNTLVSILAILSITIACGSSKESSSSKNSNLIVYKGASLDQEPELKGSLKKLQSSITYPEAAKNSGAEGKVIVELVVTKDGKGINHTVINEVHPALAQEALRVARKASFKPGIKDGEAVNTTFTITLTFQKK